MPCIARTREQVRDAAADLRECDCVVEATVLRPGAGTEPAWSISLVTDGRLQPAAMERIAAHDLRLGSFTPQGGAFETVLCP